MSFLCFEFFLNGGNPMELVTNDQQVYRSRAESNDVYERNN